MATTWSISLTPLGWASAGRERRALGADRGKPIQLLTLSPRSDHDTSPSPASFRPA